jgi:hypothetical protein
MDKYQRKLRLVIATGSAVGFLGGWALLAHAGKPVAAGTSTLTIDTGSSITIPASLPPINFSALEAQGSSGGSIQPLMTQPTFQTFSRPRLRTGGS